MNSFIQDSAIDLSLDSQQHYAHLLLRTSPSRLFSTSPIWRKNTRDPDVTLLGSVRGVGDAVTNLRSNGYSIALTIYHCVFPHFEKVVAVQQSSSLPFSPVRWYLPIFCGRKSTSSLYRGPHADRSNPAFSEIIELSASNLEFKDRSLDEGEQDDDVYFLLPGKENFVTARSLITLVNKRLFRPLSISKSYSMFELTVTGGLVLHRKTRSYKHCGCDDVVLHTARPIQAVVVVASDGDDANAVFLVGVMNFQ
ncbi:uncharacterized protein HD556DRAFT_1306812 [Suillus plorans]|uniref:Uncharacterized protein n=1 Tax=Suillus plorans TaxID=116603 RepID=A0A9P7DKN9_9AGAM|nr:uncharacterized protein HD556DRAFT_1306812 [Suillus plorans]KAG1797134.1 hypothetical protein HD556DRAFT_1306812 [Suillus plorans]